MFAATEVGWKNLRSSQTKIAEVHDVFDIDLSLLVDANYLIKFSEITMIVD